MTRTRYVSMLADFHFLRPAWLLMLLPLAWLWWQLLCGKRQSGSWQKVVDPHLLPSLLSNDSGSENHVAPYLLGTAWLILVLALAGPTWQRLPQPVYQVQQYRVIALDLSLPMNVADLKPSRLAQARFHVIDLIKQMGEGQVALIGFGAEPYVVSPLTSDGATIIAQVPLLGTDLLPTNGPPRADLALELAGELLTQAGADDGDIILLSNRVNEMQRAISAARNLYTKGYRVSVVGIGSTTGGPLPLPNGGFVKNPAGDIVISRLDTEPLAAVADAGGGRFVEARPGSGFIDLLAPGKPLRSGDIDADPADQPQADQWREAGPWLVLLLLPIAALAFRRGWISPLALTAFLLMPPPEAYALSWETLWWRNDQRAMQSLQSGDPAAAAATFERRDWRAAAAYEAGDFDSALAELEQSAETPDSRDTATAYNRGNALAHLGRLDAAIAAYDQALEVDPDDADARYNRDLIQQLLDSQQAANPQDPQQSQADQQDDEQQASEQSQGQTDSDQQGEQAQQEGQGEGPQSASDSDSQEDQQESGADASPGDDSEKASAGENTATPPDHGDDDQAGSAGAQTQADSGQQQNDDTDGSQHDPQAAEPNTGANDSDSAQPSGDTRGQTQKDEESASRGDVGDVVTEGQADGSGNDVSEAQADDASPTADGTDQDGSQQSGQKDMSGGEDSVEDNRRSANGQSDDMAAGRKPGRDDLLGGAPDSGEMQERQQRRFPRTGGTGESEQAIEQMLRRVDDDPGGLLRQRFLLQHMRRNGQLR